MSANPLKQFHADKETKEAWAAFIIDVLNQEALKRVYQGKDTTAIKEAHDIISKSFRTLDDLFTTKTKRTRRPRAQ